MCVDTTESNFVTLASSFWEGGRFFFIWLVGACNMDEKWSVEMENGDDTENSDCARGPRYHKHVAVEA